MTPKQYRDLLEHRGHRISLVTYGADDSNVWLECEDDGTLVLLADLDDDAALRSALLRTEVRAGED